MAAYSQWRLVCEVPTYGVSFAEVSLLDAAGADLFVGGTPAVGSFNSSYAEFAAFDKSTSTPWLSGTDPADKWVQYTTPAPVEGALLRITHTNLSTSYLPVRMVLLARNGDGPWETFQLLGRTPAANETIDYLLGDGTVTLRSEFEQRLQLYTPYFANSFDLVGVPIELPSYIGPGKVYGYVLKDAQPADLPAGRRRVRLYRDQDGMLVSETWSRASDGYYEFTNLDPVYRYTTIAYDYQHDFRAVAADNLTAEVAP